VTLRIKDPRDWTAKDYRVALAIRPSPELVEALLCYAEVLETQRARLALAVRTSISLN
jgi:hypothetical protein